ncbi:NAD-dependent epimerase/dehydratase family protein, partial [Bradyrhizobium sp. ORS 375]|uniref:NAD-dependent epimerase/dehydratase family protein n=1 Tax=Bradyrhizobium sp. (strain ORS 375) TaxID=566679 RepID=UPI00054ED173
MRILITGAAGFIGAALLRRLLADTAVAEITAIDLASQPSWSFDPRLRWISAALDAG